MLKNSESETVCVRLRPRESKRKEILKYSPHEWIIEKMNE